MFFIKFLESIFANSLKDKPGPSFAYAYLLSWLLINYQYPIKFLSTTGELSLKISALIDLSSTTPPEYLTPATLALAVVIFKPLLNNIGLLSREGFDKLAQMVIIKLNIKSYRTEDEFKTVVIAKETISTENSKLISDLSSLTIAKDELENQQRDSRTEVRDLTSKLSLLTTKNSELQKNINDLLSTKMELDDLKVKFEDISQKLTNAEKTNNDLSSKLSITNRNLINDNHNNKLEVTELSNALKKQVTDLSNLKNSEKGKIIQTENNLMTNEVYVSKQRKKVKNIMEQFNDSTTSALISKLADVFILDNKFPKTESTKIFKEFINIYRDYPIQIRNHLIDNLVEKPSSFIGLKV